MDKTSLGDRMKKYEGVTRGVLLPRTPAIIRVDGKAFHTLTKGAEKPFDATIAEAMDAAAIALMRQVQNARVAYVQSDEISILMIDYNTLQSQPWMSGGIQKIASVSASIAGVEFTLALAHRQNLASTTQSHISMTCEDGKYGPELKHAYFDGRVFNVPEAEVCNYFIWRQQDATRNAIQMVGQTYFSHKQLQGKSCDNIQEMLFQEHGINFNDYAPYWKRGRVFYRDSQDSVIPIFTQDREFIEKHLVTEE